MAYDGSGEFRVEVIGWLPDSSPLHDRVRQDRAPYHVWERQGLLRTVPGPVIDPQYMAREIADIVERYDV